jgi:hypothetical protein
MENSGIKTAASPGLFPSEKTLGGRNLFLHLAC